MKYNMNPACIRPKGIGKDIHDKLLGTEDKKKDKKSKKKGKDDKKSK